MKMHFLLTEIVVFIVHFAADFNVTDVKKPSSRTVNLSARVSRGFPVTLFKIKPSNTVKITTMCPSDGRIGFYVFVL